MRSAMPGLSGRPINMRLTISFIALGIHDDEAGMMFRDLQARVNRWWRYERSKGRPIGAFAGVHSHANPGGSRHVDWLAHIPETIAQQFPAKVAVFLSKITGASDLGDALWIARVDTPGSLAKYVLRGIDPAYGDYLRIQPANEGIVSGRRTGANRCIGKTARKRAGWSRKRPNTTSTFAGA